MTHTPEEDDLLAAEYVLGALDLAERSAAEARIRLDHIFAARVIEWQNRLAGLNDDYAEAPAPDLLPKIEARLFPQSAKPRRAWLSGLIGLVASTAAAFGILLFLWLQPPAPSMTASLTADASALRYEASIAGDQLTLTRTGGAAADAGKDYELWIIAGDAAPVSLGVLTAETVTIAAPKAESGFTLAITLEAKGGSPTGAPQGPIVAAGKLAKT